MTFECHIHTQGETGQAGTPTPAMQSTCLQATLPHLLHDALIVMIVVTAMCNLIPRLFPSSFTVCCKKCCWGGSWEAGCTISPLSPPLSSIITIIIIIIIIIIISSHHLIITTITIITIISSLLPSSSHHDCSSPYHLREALKRKYESYKFHGTF